MGIEGLALRGTSWLKFQRFTRENHRYFTPKLLLDNDLGAKLVFLGIVGIFAALTRTISTKP
jgi:hypothetical protein